jgi:hypothetical protein
MTRSFLPFPTGGEARTSVLLDTDIGSNVDDLLALLFRALRSSPRHRREASSPTLPDA